MGKGPSPEKRDRERLKRDRAERKAADRAARRAAKRERKAGAAAQP